MPVSSHAMPRPMISTLSGASIEVQAVEVGNFQLAAGPGLQRFAARSTTLLS